MNKKNKIEILPESFKFARKNFVKNLTGILKHMNFTAAALSLKLNTICDSDTLATSDIYEWLAGTKIPSVYHLYKMSHWFNIPMDAFFKNTFDPTTVIGHSFAKQDIKYSVEDELTQAKESLSKETTIMATKSNVVSIARSTKKNMEQVVQARTTSKNYNLLLANKIYSSEMQLKDIATKVGISTRSLRDYAFYGTSVPTEIAENLVKMFKTSFRNLGLTYNSDRDRYDHLSVKVKA